MVRSGFTLLAVVRLIECCSDKKAGGIGCPTRAEVQGMAPHVLLGINLPRSRHDRQRARLHGWLRDLSPYGQTILCSYTIFNSYCVLILTLMMIRPDFGCSMPIVSPMPWSCRRLFLVIPLLVGLGNAAAAQGPSSPLGTYSAPSLGGAGVRPPEHPPILNGAQVAGTQRHYGPTGKPCVTVEGYAQAQTINPNIFNHMISASNDCSQLIKVQVCYYQSKQCIPIDVPPYGRKEAILGIMPAMKQFRFEYREQVNQGMSGFGTGMN
jgi:hypothetical protein